jgi:hypothetical protein
VVALVAILTWVDNHQAIDQQADALKQQADSLRVEREARKREIDALEQQARSAQRQTQFEGTRLRAIVIPGQPLVRSSRLLPNGAARLTIVLRNQSAAPALEGRLSVSVVGGVIPGGLLPFLPFTTPLEEHAGLAEFAALGAGASRTLFVTVPARVLKMRRREGAGGYSFNLSYRDTIQRVSRTYWILSSLRPGEEATRVTLATRIG